MATKETYELGARNLVSRMQKTPDLKRKAEIITHLGNLRFSQYQNTREPRARTLAANCYIAARYMNSRAAIATA
jgi:hypothetical protein